MPGSRRERLRAATVEEILHVARGLLIAEGPNAISLRAIAREMGMTAPALYRYFPSREHLLARLFATIADDARRHLEHARDACTGTGPVPRLFAMSRGFREWAVAHPQEFGLIFGSPVPSLGPSDGGDDAHDTKHAAIDRFVLTFAAQFVEACTRVQSMAPPDSAIPPELVERLRAFLARIKIDLPAGAALVFLSGWVRLYGIVALEVFGHLKYFFDTAEDMFEVELADVARRLGAAYHPPC